MKDRHRDGFNWLGATLAAWVMVALARVSGLGGRWDPVSWSAWFALVLWVLAYSGGYWLARSNSVSRASPLPVLPAAWFDRWIRWLLLAAATGALLITYEFAIVRGYGFSTPVALIRIAEVDSAIEGFGGSWISGIGRMLTPALQVAWVLCILCHERLRRRTWVMLLVTTGVVFWEQILYEGGRFFLASLLVATLAARLMHRRAFARMPSERSLRWPIVLLVGVGALLGFGYVFIDRALALEMDFSLAYSTFVASFPIDASGTVLDRLSGPMAAFWFATYMLWMYVSQGPNQFNLLLGHEPFVHALGVGQFPQLGQALTKMTGLNFAYDHFAHLPNPGTYTTLVGLSYVDFGLIASWLSALALGYFTARFSQRLRSGMLHRLALTAPLLVTVGLFSPIVSLVVNLWPAFVWAALVGWASTLRRRRWRHRTSADTAVTRASLPRATPPDHATT